MPISALYAQVAHFPYFTPWGIYGFDLIARYGLRFFYHPETNCLEYPNISNSSHAQTSVGEVDWPCDAAVTVGQIICKVTKNDG